LYIIEPELQTHLLH